MAGKNDNPVTGRSDDAIYSRRQFLLNAAKLAGAAIAYPLLSSPVAAAAQTASKSSPTTSRPVGPHTVGLLMPASSYYAALSSSFIAGMSLSFRQLGMPGVEVVSEDIGSGSHDVWHKVELMIQSGGVDVLVGMVNPSVAATIRPLLEGSNKAFIASGLGENVPRTGEYSPNILYHTMDMWQANWALGNWAARNLGTTAVSGSSFYDSGYDTEYAFRCGFESGGGQIVAGLITHRPGDTGGVAPLISLVRDTHPDLVFAGYCGNLAVDLLKAYSGVGLSRSVPLIGTAYLTDRQVLASTGNAAAGIRTAFSWSRTLDTPENQAFVAAYESATGKRADPFSVLGYEAAQIIAAITAGRSPVGALSTAQFTGPRGRITTDGQTHSTVGPVYLQEAQRRANLMQNMVVEQLKAAAEQDEQIAALQAANKTGWLNTYLCD